MFELRAKSNPFKRGMIIFWSGSIASIPAGWALCNGENNTPDLRDRFIIGAKQDDGGAAKTNITGSLTKSGGKSKHVHPFNFTGGMALAAGNIINDVTPNGDYASGGAVNGSGVTSEPSESGSSSSLPPYYALVLIMKV